MEKVLLLGMSTGAKWLLQLEKSFIEQEAPKAAEVHGKEAGNVRVYSGTKRTGPNQTIEKIERSGNEGEVIGHR